MSTNATTEQKFYILWNPQSDMPPTRTFTSQSAADAVASKMANDNPGETFYVLEAKGGFLTPAKQQRIVMK